MLQYNNLANSLERILGVLELNQQTQLYQDALAISNYLTNPAYKIAVFAPFSHGKSTLLNALLGSKTLPIDLVPTTGAAISVVYGETLNTRITLQDGTIIQEPGIKILKQYAILDDDRRMKSNVSEVKVFCTNPWLKTGIEFLDLPGTNDREAQNELVKDKLLSADLIIHVLDARKLMTLEERENLTNWLYNRGINTVIFVINFLNLLTSEEQKEVKHRLCFIAESFRSELPIGISNIYCVDALPALRARLKGDQAAAKTTGLTTLETALQQIASSRQNHNFKLARVQKIGVQLLEQAIAKRSQLEQAISKTQAKEQQQITVKRQAEKLISQSFTRSISEFQAWLYFPKLLTNYQGSLAIALQQMQFDQWLPEFQLEITKYQKSINKWVMQGCEFFQHSQPQLLEISIPSAPIIQISEHPQPNNKNGFDEQTTANNTNIPHELDLLLKSKVGVVALGGASYVLNKISPKSKIIANDIPDQRFKISSQEYVQAAADYLKTVSDLANVTLTEYERLAEQYITFEAMVNQNPNQTVDHQLQLLNNLIDNFSSELDNCQREAEKYSLL